MVHLKELGLLLCDSIINGSGGLKSEGLESLILPTTETFIEMSRAELMELARSISLSNTSPGQRRADDCHWARVFGAVALSYARGGDLSVVAVLVQAAAHLGLRGPWLADAEEYILDQQQADGSFGLLASELASLQNDATVSEALLRLTVECLWALAETTALSGGRHNTTPSNQAD
jgi:hypothetical protein